MTKTKLLSPHSSVVSIGPAKEAALYFDHVYPLDTGKPLLHHFELIDGNPPPGYLEISDDGMYDFELLKDLTGSERGAKNYIVSSVLFSMSILFAQNTFDDNVDDVFQIQSYKEIAQILKIKSGFDLKVMLNYYSFKNEKEKKLKIRKMGNAVNRLLADSGFSPSPTWSSNFQINEIKNSTNNDEKYRFVLSNLDLIDFESLDWSVIKEFRADKKSRAALTKFRNFFFENFRDADPAYISDKIAVLHDEQKEAAKLWGFKMANRVISVGFDQSTALSGSVLALAGGAVGGPIAAAAGLAIPIGKILLEVSKCIEEDRAEKPKRPLEFLTMVEKLGTT